MIREILRSLFTKGSFTQNVAVVGTGKTFSAIIGFLFLPILARVYNPEAYGIFSLYFAIVTFLATLFTFSYPSAMVIAKEEKSFYNLFVLSVSTLVFFTSIQFILIIHLGEKINSTFHLFNHANYYYFLPVGVLLNGLILIFAPWNIRRKQYVFSSTVAAGHNLIIRIVNLILGILYKNNHFGLILGNQIGRSIAITSHYIKNYRRERVFLKNSISMNGIYHALINFKNYPLYILPSQILENLRNQLAIYFIGFGFNKMILGNFTMSVTFLSGPIQILSNSISAVILEKANQLYLEDRNMLPAFIDNLVTKLFILCIIPFSILIIFSQDIIIFFLGENWEIAGKFTSFLSPYFFVLLLISPLIPILQILKKERQIFIFNLSGFIANIISLYTGYYFKSIDLLILLFSLINMFLYLVQGIYIFKLIRLPIWRITLGILIVFPLCSLLFLLLKKLLFN